MGVIDNESPAVAQLPAASLYTSPTVAALAELLH